jgi:hypothetical protein
MSQNKDTPRPDPNDVLGWLARQEMGFSQVEQAESSIIMQFSLLWSLFESRVLDTRASAKGISAVSRQWSEAGLLYKESFSEPLSFFRNRYTSGKSFTHHFHDLHFRGNDDKEIVERVLLNNHESPCNQATAVLLIVYRLRNNLFHGVKWAYNLQGQYDNFYYANMTLMTAVELHKREPGINR